MHDAAPLKVEQDCSDDPLSTIGHHDAESPTVSPASDLINTEINADESPSSSSGMTFDDSANTPGLMMPDYSAFIRSLTEQIKHTENAACSSFTEVPSSYNNGMLFQCTVCSSSFNSSSALRRHVIIHDYAFTCTVCKKRFKHADKTSKSEARTHCDACEQLGEDASNVELLKSILKGKQISNTPYSSTYRPRQQKYQPNHGKPYECDICHRGFTQASHLRRHLKIHAGFKSFQCDVCFKTFARNDNLTRHKQMHN